MRRTDHLKTVNHFKGGWIGRVVAILSLSSRFVAGHEGREDEWWLSQTTNRDR